MIKLPLYVVYPREDYYPHCSLVKMAEACFLLFIQCFSFLKNKSSICISPQLCMQKSVELTDVIIFVVYCIVGICSIWQSHPFSKPSMSVSDPLHFCQTVLGAPCLCWSEPVPPEVIWLCVLSLVGGAILELPHGLQALFAELQRRASLL